MLLRWERRKYWALCLRPKLQSNRRTLNTIRWFVCIWQFDIYSRDKLPLGMFALLWPPLCEPRFRRFCRLRNDVAASDRRFSIETSVYSSDIWITSHSHNIALVTVVCAQMLSHFQGNDFVRAAEPHTPVDVGPQLYNSSHNFVAIDNVVSVQFRAYLRGISSPFCIRLFLRLFPIILCCQWRCC